MSLPSTKPAASPSPSSPPSPPCLLARLPSELLSSILQFVGADRNAHLASFARTCSWASLIARPAILEHLRLSLTDDRHESQSRVSEITHRLLSDSKGELTRHIRSFTFRAPDLIYFDRLDLGRLDDLQTGVVRLALNCSNLQSLRLPIYSPCTIESGPYELSYTKSLTLLNDALECSARLWPRLVHAEIPGWSSGWSLNLIRLTVADLPKRTCQYLDMCTSIRPNTS